jgi:hypothetical protein
MTITERELAEIIIASEIAARRVKIVRAKRPDNQEPRANVKRRPKGTKAKK